MIKLCAVDGCQREAIARGFCSMHYLRFKRKGDTGDAGPQTQVKVCKTPGCTRDAVSRGFCRTCYERWYARSKGVKPAYNWKGCSCSVCGKKPVKARGLCNSCYRKQLKKEKPNLYRKQWTASNHRAHFGGRRDQIIERSGGGCIVCGLTDAESLKLHGRQLDIHHIDEHGRTSGDPNHVIDNLVAMCLPCHISLHRSGRKLETARRAV